MGYKTAGQIIMKCKPFSYVVKESYLSSVCDFCLKLDGSHNGLKKCSKCKLVYYCKKSCQETSWNDYHKVECKYLRKLSPSVPPEILRIVARTLIRKKYGAGNCAMIMHFTF